MVTISRDSGRSRGGRTQSAVLCALLVMAAFAGCSGNKTEKEGTPDHTKSLQASSSTAPERAPEARSDAAGEPAVKQPRIKFDRPDYDFGEVEAGDDIEHAFVFENAGDAPLAIHEVLTSCGCTGAPASEKEIPPGGAGEIKAVFHSRGFQGAVKKGLTVESNDPENRFVRLTIGGQVISEVSVEPRYLNWETIRPDKAPEPRTLTIRFLPGRGLRLEKIQSESPSVVLTKVSEGENKVVYSAALAEDLPTGRFTGRITIRTNSGRVPEVHVPFQGLVQGNVKVVPYLLSFGRLRPGKASTRDLRVTKTGRQDFTVEKVKATSSAITTEVHEEKKGARYRIKVTYTPAGEARGRIAERITIFVNDGKRDFLEVPIYGTMDQGAARHEG